RNGELGLVAAAGTAAARRVVLGRLVVDLERVAAAARGDDVRVVDLEPGLLQPAEEVDDGALQVRSAERIDDDLDAVQLALLVAFLGGAIEAERVLEPRAT